MGTLSSLPKLARRRLGADIQREWADLVLIMCYLITGLLDSSSITLWGSFVSMQTGNTLYIGLGLTAPTNSTGWLKPLISLACFFAGSFLFSRFHRFFGPMRRWVLCVSFIVQLSLIAAAAAIVTFGPPSGPDSTGWNVLLPIALLSLQGCGQTVVSRALKFNSFTSVVLTSLYCDLFSDTDLFVLHNVERNRRISCLLLLLLGAVAGGLFTQSPVGSAGALWTAAGVKLFVTIAWLVWPGELDPVLLT